MTTLPVRDLVSREYVGVSESDAVRGAVELMRSAGETAAVVLRGQDAAGMLTAATVLDGLLDGADLETTTVAEIMDPAPETVAPETTVEEATRRLVGSGRSHLLVADQGGDVVGLLDARDLATARPGEQPGSTEPMATAGGGTDQATVEGGYRNQSICEGCGSFAQDLVNVDGQLLCPDCRDV
ncbi:MAG: CBS domain-containing protein [Halodesulfurarchaeum sp.]